MEKAEILFESYNMAVEKSYNQIFMSNKSHELLNIEDETIRQHLAGDLETWENTPNADLDGISPTDYFKTVTQLEELVELFKVAAKLCDNDIPDPLINRLETFNEAAVNELLVMSKDKRLLDHDEDKIISVMAIRTIGKWK